MRLSISLFLSLIQCLCACHVTPGPATNWVSPSFSFLSLNATSHTLPPSPPPTSLHRCLSVALSTAWSVPLSAGCMVVIFNAACNRLGGRGGWRLYLMLLFDHRQGMGGVKVSIRYWWEFTVTCWCRNTSDVARVKMIYCTSFMLNIASTLSTVYFNKVPIMLLCNSSGLRIYACI